MKIKQYSTPFMGLIQGKVERKPADVPALGMAVDFRPSKWPNPREGFQGD